MMVICYKVKQSVFINIFELSKGLDVLYANQEKIMELTKIKGFIQLTNEDYKNISQEIKVEKSSDGNKKTKEPVRPPDGNSDDKKS
jgi:hypothetical protein